MSFFESVYEGILLTSLWEWIAVFTGVVYVILAALRSNLCWFFAAVSSGIYVYLCIDGQLYIESVLQVFYVVMAIVGWFSWRNNSGIESQELDASLGIDASKEEIKTWPISYHLYNLAISGGIAFILGVCFDTLTDQANPYADAFTTVFSLAATFMVVRKVLENWIYWIVIDLVSIFLYHHRGYSLSAVLYFVFTLLAIAGLIAWYKKYKKQLA
ncbi:MAG: nicotinamide riboside transporter PnuC [Crocinitomicaceae bacterium]|nr:nicotinamide riboside transporter PnuC [Crocinitomicaceae bacterium]